MKPFKIGIWIDEHIYPEIGGAHSYTQKLINGIDSNNFNKKLEIVFVGFNIKAKLNKAVIPIPFKENLFEKKRKNALHKILGIKLERKDLPNNFKNAIAILKENDIQLLFYLTPHVSIGNFPYIITNWDLAHKSTYAFPEFSMNGQFEYRDKYFGKILNEALLVCCESEQGKLEIEKAYGIEQNKIKILPMFAGSVVDQETAELSPGWIDEKAPFFLYPAQFWPHKNHYNLILAFRDFISSSQNKDFKLVLTGSDKGNLAYIKEVIKSLEIEDQVIIAGFVNNLILKWLYKNTKGLVFPSFLGPTNMPLLEAQQLGCNIACSNLKGHKTLLHNDAIYFEPANPHSIKEAMVLLNTKDQPAIQPDAIALKDELKILEQIFIESINIRKTWGQFDNIS